MVINIKPITHEIQLNFGSSDIKRTVIKQNSDQTHILSITLYDNNDRLKLAPDWEIVISARKPDNKFIINDVEEEHISLTDDKINVTVTRQMLSVPGTVKCELCIYKPDGACYFSDTFFIYVEPNVNYSSELESTDEYLSIVNTLNHVREYEQSAQKSKEHIDNLETEINGTYEDLKEAVKTTDDLIQKNLEIQENESDRQQKEKARQEQEEKRQTDTANALQNVQDATKRANTAAQSCEGLLSGMMEPLSDTEPADQQNGFFWLQEY